MATIQETVSITDDEQEELNDRLQKQNAVIDAENRRIQANKDLAAAQGTVYNGPEPRAPLTFQDVVQERWHQANEGPVRQRVQEVSNTVAELYMNSDPAQRQAMMLDLAKYQPNRPTAENRVRRR